MKKMLQRLNEANKEYLVDRFASPVTKEAALRGEVSKETLIYAKVATVEGYRVAYLSRDSFARYTKDNTLRYYALKLDGTPDSERVATKNTLSSGWRVDGTVVSSKKAALAYLSVPI